MRLAALFLLSSLVPLWAQTASPDTTETTIEDAEEAAEEIAEDIVGMRVRPIFSLSSLYSPSKGFGVGGGVALNRVALENDHLQIEARLSERFQGAFGEYLTGDVRRDPVVMTLGGAGWTTSRTRFVGHGPRSEPSGSLFLDRAAAEAEVRVGWSPLGPGGLLLQPKVRFQFDRIRGFEESDDDGLESIRPLDLERLQALEGTDRYGIEVALSAIRDTRDIRAMPSRGSYLQAQAGRFQSLDGSGLGYWQAQGLAYAFRPALFRLPFIPDRGALFVRATAVVTREDGDEGGGLPWIYLPDLDRDLLVGYPRSEFIGRDALSLGVGARGVIGEAIGAFLFEGVAMAMVGAAYDDVFEEFTPTLAFSRDSITDEGSIPFLPSLAVGMNIHFIDRERAIIGALLGVGPTGTSLAGLRLVYGLGDYRPRLR